LINPNGYEKGATDVPKKVAYIRLPYSGRSCEQYDEKLKRLYLFYLLIHNFHF
jgi:hypothetical protein